MEGILCPSQHSRRLMTDLYRTGGSVCPYLLTNACVLRSKVDSVKVVSVEYKSMEALTISLRTHFAAAL